MVDIQNQIDNRDVPLQKVGIKGLQYPVKVLDKINGTQNTSCTADLYVNLPQHFKGTHMSRFIEIFHKYHEDLSMKRFLAMLEEIRKRLDAEQAFGRLTFPFFIEKKAPVSNQSSMMSYKCTYEGTVNSDSRNFFVSIEVPVSTLCPCSKAISLRGAHNQRGLVNIKIQSSSFFWIEDIIILAEKSASTGLYSLLKRSDEKYVTELAYDNPRFVEDVVREIYIALLDFRCGDGQPINWFSIEAENFESIHNHNAYAQAEFKS